METAINIRQTRLVFAADNTLATVVQVKLPAAIASCGASNFTEGGFYQPRSARCVPEREPSIDVFPQGTIYLRKVVGLADWLQGVVAHTANAA